MERNQQAVQAHVHLADSQGVHELVQPADFSLFFLLADPEYH